MSASLVLLALAAQQIVVPLGKARPSERPVAPIATAGPAFARACADDDDWDKPAPPVRLHGNSYYVGTCGISAILVTGPEGHVLIDTGTEAGAELVAANIRRLGFTLADVKWITHSHEHHDHVGGLARMVELTGARIAATAAAAPVLRTGLAAAGDPQFGTLPRMAPVAVARVLRDGDTIRLGPVQLTAHTTPGHTDGALSWTWTSCDGGVCRDFAYADSLSAVSREGYRFSDDLPRQAAFRASFAKVAAFGCDILITPHPGASGLRARLAQGRPLLDPQGCKAFAAAKGRALDERLAKEAAGQ